MKLYMYTYTSYALTCSMYVLVSLYLIVDVHKWTGSAEVYSEIALVYRYVLNMYL